MIQVLLTMAIWYSVTFLRHLTLKGNKVPRDHISSRKSAVLRRTATITNARSMHEFLLQNFSLPAASSFSSRANSVHLKRRIFFYVPASGEGAIQRNRPGRQFKTLKGIMKLQCQDASSTREAVGQITFLLLRELCPGRSAKLPQQRLAWWVEGGVSTLRSRSSNNNKTGHRNPSLRSRHCFPYSRPGSEGQHCSHCSSKWSSVP